MNMNKNHKLEYISLVLAVCLIVDKPILVGRIRLLGGDAWY